MNVDSITLNSLVLYIPIRLVVLCPLGETGENKNKCQVPGSWELGSGGAEHCLLGVGLGAREFSRGPGWRQTLWFPNSLLHKTYLSGRVFVSHCPTGRSRARVTETCTCCLEA